MHEEVLHRLRCPVRKLTLLGDGLGLQPYFSLKRFFEFIAGV